MASSELSSHAQINRAAWTEYAAVFSEWAPRAWARNDIVWGVWKTPESDLGVLPDVAGKDVVELGCGTAYFSSWLARRGARVVGIDITPAQLETARALQREHDLDFPLLEASAEDVPLPDESFDVAISEYGASLWADPYRWIPEAARLLRPGGELVFLTNGTIFVLCAADEEVPPGRDLRRPYFGLHRLEWAGTPPTVEFHLGYGDWIRLLRANGFDVVDLVEVSPPPDAVQHDFAALPTLEWARQWPSEEIWRARKRDV